MQRLAAVYELSVHLVADDEQIVLLSDIEHQLQLVRREDGAGRVAGVRDHDGAGVLVYAGLDALAHGVAVVLLGAGRQRVDGSAGEGDGGVVVRVERFGNDDLVAVVKQRRHGHLQRFAAAGGDKDVLFIQLYADIVVIIADRVDKCGNAGGGSVREYRLAELPHGLKVGVGGLYIRLADVEMIYLYAALHGFVGVTIKLSHRRKTAFFHF